jgi:hypothetical protein
MSEIEDILRKISKQLEEIIVLLEKATEKNKPFVPPDCEHL